jgi:hypothetical protein
MSAETEPQQASLENTITCYNRRCRYRTEESGKKTCTAGYVDETGNPHCKLRVDSYDLREYWTLKITRAANEAGASLTRDQAKHVGNVVFVENQIHSKRQPPEIIMTLNTGGANNEDND